jgi:hypothetical protein
MVGRILSALGLLGLAGVAVTLFRARRRPKSSSELLLSEAA